MNDLRVQLALLLLVAAYCVARAVMDFAARRWVLAAAGVFCAAVILMLPIRTHAVKVDLPVGTR